MSDNKTLDQSLAILDPIPMEEAFGAIDEMAIETYGVFLSSTEPLLSAIGTHLLADEMGPATDAAHSAKGAARMTGAFRLAAVCSAIEQDCKQGDKMSALAWLALVPAAFEQVRAAIRQVELTGVFPQSGD